MLLKMYHFQLKMANQLALLVKVLVAKVTLSRLLLCCRLASGSGAWAASMYERACTLSSEQASQAKQVESTSKLCKGACKQIKRRTKRSKSVD